ncbi:MAG: phosphatidate cytidylyltransferase [Planctomycetota bacterium]|nr:phosphatidate cytidylyltransferase [Planctomycetota bacterium]
MGGSLALGVGLLLWGASGPLGPYLVLGCGVAMALGCVAETRALKLFAGPASQPGHGVLLGVLAVAVAAIALIAQVQPGADARPEHFDVVGRLAMAVIAVGVVGLALGWVSRAHPIRALASLLWIALPLPALYLVVVETGVAGLGALILLSKVGDIAGYYSGNLLGARFPHHPFPRLSPGKTTVGCLGSFLVGTAAGPLLPAAWLPDPRWGVASVLAAAALVNLASQAGDLLESAAKRQAGVKDSGTLFGPSGGFLDLVDSLLLSVPVALLTWPLLFEGFG